MLAWPALALAAVLGGCGEGADWPERPNILVLSLDAVRADHLGLYGETRPTSPNLDAFAKEAMVFDAAFTPEPWTLTAHMSLLTGLHPSVHGANAETTLPTSIPTLAEALKTTGYTTIGVVADTEWIAPRYGFNRGMDDFAVVPTDARRGVDATLAAIDRAEKSSPHFVFLHLYDAHSDWKRRPYEAEQEDREAVGEPSPGFPGCLRSAGCASKLLRAHNRGVITLDHATIQSIDAQYAAGIRGLDREVGRLLHGLEHQGWLDEAIVVITADHGEEMSDHGRMLHDQLYDETARVPMIIRTPETRGSHCDAFVSLVDVAPTLAALTGISLAATDGRSFAHQLVDCDSLPRRAHVIFDTREGLSGLRTRTHSIFRSGDAWKLYDLRVDPGQSRNLLGDETSKPALRDLHRTLRDEARRLAQLRARVGTGATLAPLAELERARLEILGYLLPDAPPAPGRLQPNEPAQSTGP